MKRIVRLTESDLARIVRRVIKENNDDELLSCIADAYDLTLVDILKLAPCSDCQKDPSPENAEKCLKAVEKVVRSKDYNLMQLAQMTLEATKCSSKLGGSNRIKVPGYGGGQF